MNLSIRAGDRVAVVGRNGSGKSTLLRVMARIFAPTSGQVEWADGVSVSLLSLGLGFNPVLSGRDNAYLSCLLVGLSQKEALESLERIEAFCELGSFFAEPVHTYSAGMRARLGFGTALEYRSQVILIDEVLSVGDRAFREKARRRWSRSYPETARWFGQSRRRTVRRLCQRATSGAGSVVAEGDCTGCSPATVRARRDLSSAPEAAPRCLRLPP